MYTFPCTEKIKGSRCSFRIDHFAFLSFPFLLSGLLFAFPRGPLRLQRSLADRKEQEAALSVTACSTELCTIRTLAR